MAQLFRTTAAALQDGGTDVTWLCDQCLFKAGPPRSVALPLVGFGLLLLGLLAAATWLSRL